MSDFARIKDAVPLLDFILRESGGRVGKKFSGYVQLEACPFCGGHECFSVHDAEERYFKCFQCEARGDIFGFARLWKEELRSPIESLRYVAQAAGIEIGDAQEAATQTAKQRIWEEATRYFQGVLFAPRNSAPLAYLTSARGHSRIVLEEFGIGFTDGALARHLEKSFSHDELLSSGLALSQGGRVLDKWPPGYFVFPHKMSSRKGFAEIGDFTLKPFGEGKRPIRLQSEYREPGCLFFNQGALSGDEIVVVEGQNDLLSIVGRGEYPNVVATCGQLTEGQIELLKKSCRSICACFDRDDAGKKYFKKLEAALRPELLPPRLRQIAGGEETRLRRVEWFGEAKDIDEYLRGRPQPAEAFARLLSGARAHYRPLTECLSIFRSHAADRKLKFDSPEAAKIQGQIIFEWLGGEKSFFVESSGAQRPYLVYNHKVYPLTQENQWFRALLYDLADIVCAEARSRAIFDTLECRALLEGRQIEVSPWLHVQNDSEIFLHTARADDAVLRIAPGSVTVVPNAESCLLRPSNKMQPICFDPSVDIRSALSDFSSLFLANLATTAENRLFIAGWIFNVFMLGFSRDRAILQFTGGAASGKTTAANLASLLIYGEDWVGKSKTASDYADGMTNPLMIKDNLEARDIDRGTLNFLLAAATGTVNQKRKGGTDSENVYERLNNQVLCTAIEPFEAHELITRTWTIHFEPHHRSPAFQKTAVIERMKEQRSKILSAFFLILAGDILPTYAERRRFYLGHIRQCFPSHSKQRLDEFLAGLFVLVEGLLKYLPAARHIPADHATRALIDETFRAQEEVARETEEQTSPVLFFLTELSKEFFFCESSRNFQSEYKLRLDDSCLIGGAGSQFVFRASSSDLFGAFKYLAKKRGFTECFTSAQQLGARLSDSRETLARAGWEVDARISRGNRIYHFRKQREDEA
ncbi:MAG: toprim domain-containing protein [Chrysiogenetes bacterium]|nr:toprim domain-containing protein [Chrysiogenetes bacterium]